MGCQETHPDPFVRSVGRFIDERRLLSRSQCVLVGVSGGPDSVALLAALVELAGETRREYRLIVGHLNHRLREQAGADAAFVETLAERWNLPCVSRACDVGELARGTGWSVELAARDARLDFFRRAAKETDASAIALAHHADDNVETVLFRLFRGTHLRGLAGIPAARPLSPGVRIVRPLLETFRREIEDFCRRRGLAWRTDHTNADTRFTRNFIRRRLLPMLRERFGPGVDDAVARLSIAAGETEEFLRSLAEDLFERCHRTKGGRMILDAAELSRQPMIMRRYVMRLALECLGVPLRDIGADRLATLAGLVDLAAPAAVCLPGGFVARREGGWLVIETATEKTTAPPGDEDDEKKLATDGETLLPGGFRIRCRVGPFDREAFKRRCTQPEKGVELLDADCIHGPLRSRCRRDGDAFKPLGAPGGKSVSDFLTDLKLPGRLRRQVRCICDDEGIVYLAPLRIADRVKVTGETRRILRMDFDVS